LLLFPAFGEKMENTFLNWKASKGIIEKEKKKKITERYFQIAAFYCKMWYDSHS